MSEPIAVEEARRRVLGAVRLLEGESVSVDAALGRVLCEEVVSEVDVPPFDNSAMDGFAVPAGAEGALEIAAESRAGKPAAEPLAAGAAARISTGAAVPLGTAAVVPSEDAVEEAGSVQVPSRRPGANIRRRGEDIAAGEPVLFGGQPLGPAALGVLASVGRTTAVCARRPAVAILATGDELVEPGRELGPGQIWSSNTPALAGQVTEADGVVERRVHLPDDLAATRLELGEAAARADLVVVSGGVSVGPHDHVKGALSELGAETVFWGVALRPGKPAWFGLLGAGERPTPVFGLPGNPVSAMVCFQLFVRPALRAMQGADPGAERTSATLDADIPRHPRRVQAVRCRLRRGDQGLHAEPTGPQGSHVLTSMLGADALALVESGEGSVLRGEQVTVELLA